MTHGRKYGEKDSHPIPVWNGIFDHYDRIGIALWTFEWLIDRIPKDGEQNGIGKVLGGKPIKIAEIVQTVKGSTYKGIRRQLDALEEQGYISRRRTPYGFVIEVRNSRKWGIWIPKETSPKGQSLPIESGQKGQSEADRVDKKGTEIAPRGQNKENTTVPSSKETQQKAAAELWTVLGIAAQKMPPAFRELCEQLYATKNGQPLCEFVGACMRGAPYLATLLDSRDVSVDLPNAARRIRQLSASRKLIHTLEGLQEQAFNSRGNVAELLDTAIEKLSNQARDVDETDDMGVSHFDAATRKLSELKEGARIKIFTGVDKLDRLTGGFRESELVTLTADTGVGKTLLASQTRAASCRRGYHSLYCSAETTAAHLKGRELAANAGVSPIKMAARIYSIPRIGTHWWKQPATSASTAKFSTAS
jgi:hypothetical protein